LIVSGHIVRDDNGFSFFDERGIEKYATDIQDAKILGSESFRQRALDDINSLTNDSKNYTNFIDAVVDNKMDASDGFGATSDGKLYKAKKNSTGFTSKTGIAEEVTKQVAIKTIATTLGKELDDIKKKRKFKTQKFKNAKLNNKKKLELYDKEAKILSKNIKLNQKREKGIQKDISSLEARKSRQNETYLIQKE